MLVIIYSKLLILDVRQKDTKSYRPPLTTTTKESSSNKKKGENNSSARACFIFIYIKGAPHPWHFTTKSASPSSSSSSMSSSAAASSPWDAAASTSIELVVGAALELLWRGRRGGWSDGNVAAAFEGYGRVT